MGIKCIRHCDLTSVDLSTGMSTFNQRYIAYAVITRDTIQHCGNTGGEVQYGYKVSPGPLVDGSIIYIIIKRCIMGTIQRVRKIQTERCNMDIK